MIVFLDCEPETHAVWRAAADLMARGMAGTVGMHKMSADEFVNDRPWPCKVDGVVHFHYHGSGRQAIEICRARGIPHYWIEGPYIKKPGHFRITKNANQAPYKLYEKPRPGVLDGVHVAPWRMLDGFRKIVFCVAADDMAEFNPAVRQWEADVLDYLESVRRIDDVILRRRTEKKPLQEDLADAECLISYNSIAAVDSLLAGVPVIVSPESSCYAFSRWNMLNLWRGSREPLLNLISWNQFSTEELADGTAWERVK